MSLSALSLLEIMKKNAWNIRRLDAGSFVQTNQQPSVLYCKLTDFWFLTSINMEVDMDLFWDKDSMQKRSENYYGNILC